MVTSQHLRNWIILKNQLLRVQTLRCHVTKCSPRCCVQLHHHTVQVGPLFRLQLSATHLISTEYPTDFWVISLARGLPRWFQTVNVTTVTACCCNLLALSSLRSVVLLGWVRVCVRVWTSAGECLFVRYRRSGSTRTLTRSVPRRCTSRTPGIRLRWSCCTFPIWVRRSRPSCRRCTTVRRRRARGRRRRRPLRGTPLRWSRRRGFDRGKSLRVESLRSSSAGVVVRWGKTPRKMLRAVNSRHLHRSRLQLGFSITIIRTITTAISSCTGLRWFNIHRTTTWSTERVRRYATAVCRTTGHRPRDSRTTTSSNRPACARVTNSTRCPCWRFRCRGTTATRPAMTSAPSGTRMCRTCATRGRDRR